MMTLRYMVEPYMESDLASTLMQTVVWAASSDDQERQRVRRLFIRQASPLLGFDVSLYSSTS